mmetsp:Transcript_67909/g.196595  ORF Transcript_67909/g.196595 Transcript_67909/m.196595 type:complete len:213 (+) Transcript_67909:1281-1919(+)
MVLLPQFLLFGELFLPHQQALPKLVDRRLRVLGGRLCGLHPLSVRLDIAFRLIQHLRLLQLRFLQPRLHLQHLGGAARFHLLTLQCRLRCSVVCVGLVSPEGNCLFLQLLQLLLHRLGLRLPLCTAGLQSRQLCIEGRQEFAWGFAAQTCAVLHAKGMNGGPEFLQMLSLLVAVGPRLLLEPREPLHFAFQIHDALVHLCGLSGVHRRRRCR